MLSAGKCRHQDRSYQSRRRIDELITRMASRRTGLTISRVGSRVTDTDSTANRSGR